MSKVIAVIGSTGMQGGGVVDILSGKEGYEVRAITRNPDSDKAKALVGRPGVTVVKADTDDVESLKAAFAGCYGVFVVTNFWEHFCPGKETQQVKNCAEAAKATDVKHVIWSTLENPSQGDQSGMEKIKSPDGTESIIPHFQGKADADKHLEGVPHTLLYTSFYWENIVYLGMHPQKGEDGKLAMTMPHANDCVLPAISAPNIGHAAAGIFMDPSAIGKSIYLAGENHTFAELVAKLAKHLEVEIAANSVPADMYRKFGFPGAEELGNMFQWQEQNPDLFSKHRVDNNSLFKYAPEA